MTSEILGACLNIEIDLADLAYSLTACYILIL